MVVQLADSEMLDQLKVLDKLGRNQELTGKVFRAMNNWIRVHIEDGGMPSTKLLQEMID